MFNLSVYLACFIIIIIYINLIEVVYGVSSTRETFVNKYCYGNENYEEEKGGAQLISLQ